MLLPSGAEEIAIDLISSPASGASATKSRLLIATSSGFSPAGIAAKADDLLAAARLEGGRAGHLPEQRLDARVDPRILVQSIAHPAPRHPFAVFTLSVATIVAARQDRRTRLG